jgi:hypothetical protein
MKRSAAILVRFGVLWEGIVQQFVQHSMFAFHSKKLRTTFAPHLSPSVRPRSSFVVLSSRAFVGCSGWRASVPLLSNLQHLHDVMPTVVSYR